MTTSIAPRSRAKAKQLSKMADFMLENPGLADGTFKKLHGQFKYDDKWNELAEMLNSLGGAVKTVHQWHTVWRDLKSRTNIKYRVRKKQQSLTENRPINQESITEHERRVIALIGSDYIEEPVVVNEPMEKESEERLEEEDDSVFSDVPSSSSTPGIEFQSVASNNSVTLRRCPKRKNEEDGRDTKTKFLEIAKTQADALKMLAEASVASVEIAKTQAVALNMIAECSAASIEANKKMAEAIKTMGEGLKHIADAFNLL